MGPTRNLILVFTPGLQAREDFEEIARKARRLDPETEVFLADNDRPRMRPEPPSRPTLIFSPVHLKSFAPKRGTVFQGGFVDKLDQYARFLATGIRTPKTALLAPEAVFPESEWGEHVVLKPLSPAKQSTGKSVYLIRTRRLNYDLRIAKLFDRYNVDGGVLVQRFIDSGPHLEYHRVLALFGKPLYVMQTRVTSPVNFDEGAHANGTISIANLAFSRGEKARDFVSDSVFFEIAENCFRAFPDRALQAIDVLRERQTGDCYVIEANLGGNTWHFSSGMLQRRVADEAFVRQLTEHKINQFGAFDVAARALVEQTRLHAT